MSALETTDDPTRTQSESEPLQRNGVTKMVEQKQTCYASFILMMRNITVEPTLTLLILTWIMVTFSTQNLILEKACRVNLNFTTEVCDALRAQDTESQNEFEREVQLLVSRFIPYKTYISASISSFLTLLAGCYSDKTGQRKLFILVAIVGQMIVCINNMFNVFFFYELNLQVLVFSEAVIEGLCGAISLPTFIIITYIISVTTAETRTFRLGLLNFSLTIGFPLGLALSGIMINHHGFYGSFGLALAFLAVNFLYTVLVVNDTEKTPAQEKRNNKGAAYKLRSFFNFLNIWESLRVVFRSGPNYRRLRMFIYMIVSAILFGLTQGESALLYLMVRYRFNWDELQYSIYQTYSFITQTSGTIFVITVFSRWLGWHDSLLGIITGICKISAYFVYCFAPNSTVFYLGPVVEAMSTSVLSIRSIISKMADFEELGKVMSIIALADSLAPLVIIPLYTAVYQATIKTLPGAVYLVGAAIVLPTLLVFSWLFYEHRTGRVKMEKEKPEEVEEVLMQTI